MYFSLRLQWSMEDSDRDRLSAFGEGSIYLAPKGQEYCLLESNYTSSQSQLPLEVEITISDNM